MLPLKLPPGTGIVNPIDTPVGTLLQSGGAVAAKILDIVYASSGADALVMHPGPINRGVEIVSAVADGPRSLINEQVEMGVAVRMAVLEALAQNLPNE